MKRPAPLLLAGTLIAGLFVLFLAVRTGHRYYVLHKVLKRPESRLRVNVAPKIKRLESSKTTNEVNLGYAQFSFPNSTGMLSVQSAGSDGVSLIVTNQEFQMVFLPPFALSQATNSFVTIDSYPQMARLLQHAKADPIGTEVEIERACPLPIIRVAAMTKDEFLLYFFSLGEKACFRRGMNEVYSFTTSRIKGIVRIGDSAQDRRVASASVASVDGNSNVGLHLFLGKDVSTDIAQALDVMLGSFQFTTHNVANCSEVSNLIFQAVYGGGTTSNKRVRDKEPAGSLRD